MPHPLNLEIAARLDEVAQLLAEQGASRYRVDAYRRGAETLRGLPRPVSAIIHEEGLAGLERLPAIGQALARAAAYDGSSAPAVADLLAVDREYRTRAAEGSLRTIAPRRFNPKREAWLPVLHTRRAGRDYTALFSNTQRAHELGRTRDWVAYYREHGLHLPAATPDFVEA